MKILLGLFLGIITMMLVRETYASQNRWKVKVNNTNAEVVKITDGNVNCYITQTYYAIGISCVK